MWIGGAWDNIAFGLRTVLGRRQTENFNSVPIGSARHAGGWDFLGLWKWEPIPHFAAGDHGSADRNIAFHPDAYDNVRNRLDFGINSKSECFYADNSWLSR